MEKQSSAWAYVCGLFTAAFGGITLDTVAMLVGIVTAVGTFLINWYYKAKYNAIIREYHATTKT